MDYIGLTPRSTPRRRRRRRRRPKALRGRSQPLQGNGGGNDNKLTEKCPR
jgi:hypothetical protein